jgi:phosphoribosyl-dephospho-CoA transferase
MPHEPLAVHALLRAAPLEALTWELPAPEWARASLQRAPWVVVRRAARRAGMWPVGVRGALRVQRGAAWLPDFAVQACITPLQLAARLAWRQHPVSAASPAVAALDEVAAILAAHGHAGRWGPAGSVGFELASALPCTGAHSDLDLVLMADQPMARTEAAGLHADLSQLPVRIDLLLETPDGAVALSEYATAGRMVLLGCAQGPRLVCDPWRSGRAAAQIA